MYTHIGYSITSDTQLARWRPHEKISCKNVE